MPEVCHKHRSQLFRCTGGGSWSPGRPVGRSPTSGRQSWWGRRTRLCAPRGQTSGDRSFGGRRPAIGRQGVVRTASGPPRLLQPHVELSMTLASRGPLGAPSPPRVLMVGYPAPPDMLSMDVPLWPTRHCCSPCDRLVAVVSLHYLTCPRLRRRTRGQLSCPEPIASLPYGED